MTKSAEIHVYLAGPDVFFPDAPAVGARKKDYLAKLGMVGHFPFDNEIDVASYADRKISARKIAEMNEQMMLSCIEHGRFGIILANMTPYHGPSADVGTAFEMGFMSALSYSSNLLIVGYTGDRRDFADRVSEDIYQGKVAMHGGRLIGSDGCAIENFGGADNLMLVAAIERTGGKILPTFEEAARYCFEAAARRAAAISPPSP